MFIRLVRALSMQHFLSNHIFIYLTTRSADKTTNLSAAREFARGRVEPGGAPDNSPLPGRARGRRLTEALSVPARSQESSLVRRPDCRQCATSSSGMKHTRLSTRSGSSKRAVGTPLCTDRTQTWSAPALKSHSVDDFLCWCSDSDGGGGECELWG